MLMGIIPKFGFLKLESSGFMRLVHSTKWCRKTLTISIMSHMSSKKHSNAAGQSSRGSSNKGRMQLTSYLWKKIGMLWKNYGKAMEFVFWGSVRTLHLDPPALLIKVCNRHFSYHVSYLSNCSATEQVSCFS